MTCAKFETDIALYAGGDLPPARIARVEAHLAECAECRALAGELRDEHALLSELREDPLEDAMVAQVRQRVLVEVAATTRQPSRPYWKLALAAALLLAAVLAWPRHHPPKQILALRGAGPRPAAASHAAQPAAPLVRNSRRRAHLHRAPMAQPGPPLLVQFVTDDPNIVVYWLIDRKPKGD